MSRDVAGQRFLGVVNPGTHPAPRWIAAAAAAAGSLDFYATGLATSSAEAARLGWLPGPIRTMVRQRTLPPSIETRMLMRAGRIDDLRATRALHAGDGVRARALLTARNERIALMVNSAISKGSRSARVLLMPTGTRTNLAVQSSLPVVLYTTLPLRSYGDTVLKAEAERNPRWAAFMGDIADSAEVEIDYEAELAAAAGVLANSSFTAASFLEAGIRRENIHVEPLSLDPGRVRAAVSGIRPEPSADQFNGKRPLQLLYAGQIVQRKGLSYLFDALSRLPAGRVELTLVGSDPVQMAAALSHAYPSVVARFTGPMAQDRLWRLMAGSDLFVFPSLLEGFGNVLLEALAAGLPVLTTANTGAPDLDIFGRCAVRVEAADAASIEAELQLIIDRPEILAELRRGLPTSDWFGGWSAYAANALKYLEGFGRH